MKNICIILLGIFLLVSCNCGHAPNQHIPNDTVKCVVIDKGYRVEYDPVLHIFRTFDYVTILNPTTTNIANMRNSFLFSTVETGDSINLIYQHCPTKNSWFEWKE
jgi:hypothetical protein